VKVTCRRRYSFPVVGYAMKEPKFDGLYLGREQDGELFYAPKVEQGFSDADVKSVRERLKPLLQRAQALSRKINKPKARWVKPGLLADVEYRALTGEGKLRRPSFKGIRQDLSSLPSPTLARSRSSCGREPG
jgi:bifunctional non-homologous end joining protein LigD